MAALVVDSPAPSAAAIHVQVAEAFALDARGAELVRAALVLSADHELNASSFAARVVASTGASVRAAIIAGLAALTGPRHGGATARVEAFFDAVGSGDPDAVLRDRLIAGEDAPGFGHPLYPNGDPRAAAILAWLRDAAPEARTIAEAQERLTGRPPMLDFALVALAPNGVRVNAVCPGFVKTGMQAREIEWESCLRNVSAQQVVDNYVAQTPLGRLEEPEDVADVVVFLCSDKARFMTGQGINVTGGVYMT
jgi:hypothetical protein